MVETRSAQQTGRVITAQTFLAVGDNSPIVRQAVCRVAQLRQAFLDCFRIIRDTFEAAFVQHRFRAVRKIEQPPLERRRAEIGDENFHEAGGVRCEVRAVITSTLALLTSNFTAAIFPRWPGPRAGGG